MKRELLRYQIFAGLESYVAEFASVAETVLSECARQEITAMNQEERSNYRKLLQHLDTFYYHGLWKQITRLIAVHTVDGPDDYFERAANWGRIEKTKEKFIEVFGEFKETASEYDIEVEINEERLPEVWVTKESITKEEFINWELEQALSRDAVSPVPEDDPIHDLVG
jgi:uncharacterized protein YhaN